ncbi:NAD(P)H-hydrate dehydratase [Vagococcus elongatus]|uniref:ADP-dependent (S)-NAD(P)H-hydrate dehydratase n=1 Tax=Vagococcus elongatus TaxID=180344 RepID=A0A430B467_9ENTE|nr:NAD(P)H-hydrate dehydratase [Vagococcus elongatus]RSU15089.1 NAD(P)H-hydrate dehydratase [Vagococcus elongatus]
MKVISKSILNEVITQRPPHSHKGNYGKVCLIGGNSQYGGAIILASQAAVHSGAGLVSVVTASKNHGSLHARLPEAMVIDWENRNKMCEGVNGASVVLIGPGLGLEEESLQRLKLVLSLLKQSQVCIIDGSAITLIAQYKIILPPGPMYIFTPHEKEWERLSGLPIGKQLLDENRRAKKEIDGVVVLKKHRTEVFFDDNVWQNPIGTPAMATGGMGDTLAGMIAGFSAQFQPIDQAVLAAVYLHSYIGEKIGENHYVVLPTKVIEEISLVMKQFETESKTGRLGT